MRKVVRCFASILVVILLPACSPAAEQGEQQSKQSEQSREAKPVVILDTSHGVIKMELYPGKAPVTVENFLAYVDDGLYDGTIFHRVIGGFMIQGGSFAPDMKPKPTKPPIKNEADNGLKNDTGTVAMARTPVRDSATSQFFINLSDNGFLNHGSRDFGYAVFASVIEGMDVVEKVASVSTSSKGGHQNLPTTPVVIESARRE